MSSSMFRGDIIIECASPTSPRKSCYTPTSPVLRGVTECQRAGIQRKASSRGYDHRSVLKRRTTIYRTVGFQLLWQCIRHSENA
jgi:hypothetical protein